MSGPDQEPPQPGNRDEEIKAVSAVLGVSLDAAAKAIEDGLDVESATELVRTQQVLRDQKELRQAVGDWLNRLTDRWKPFSVEEVGYRPFTRSDEALGNLIGGSGCAEMRFGVCVYDAECPENEERSLILWLEGTGIGSQSLRSIQERVRPEWLWNAFQTDGHCCGCPTVRHDDGIVVFEPEVSLRLTNRGIRAKQAILDGDVETTLKRICRHVEFSNEPEAECRLHVVPTELVSDATELPSVPNGDPAFRNLFAEQYWIKISDASRQTGIGKGKLSHAATNGFIVSNGFTHNKRRLLRSSLSLYEQKLLEQQQ